LKYTVAISLIASAITLFSSSATDSIFFAFFGLLSSSSSSSLTAAEITASAALDAFRFFLSSTVAVLFSSTNPYFSTKSLKASSVSNPSGIRWTSFKKN
jgi:hypothetical protein